VAKSKINLRDSELQARLGLIFSVVGVVFSLLLAIIVLEHFSPAQKTIAYSPKSLRQIGIQGGTAATGFVGVVAFWLGVMSLGHKRNARQRESWIGLLLGALSICLAIVLFAMFQMFKLPIVVS